MSGFDSHDDERLKVLLVEDNLVDAHLIIAMLDSEAMYQVTLAQDGMKGSLLATEQQWDLLITDLNLPGDSGIDVIRQSKEHHPTTPVITTTGYTAPRYVQGALRAGADEVLTKPIERDEILRKLLYVLGTKRSRGRRAAERTVLAVGARPGDIESGCGGILMGHGELAQRVVLLPLEGADTLEAEQAAEAMGAKLIGPNMKDDGTPDTAEAIAEAIRSFSPDTVYIPSGQDEDEGRLACHRAGLISAAQVDNVYCYQTPTSTTDFRPTLFVEVGDHLDAKVDVVSNFTAPEGRDDFDPELIRSTARYWGRFDQAGLAEPLEVVRSGM